MVEDIQQIKYRHKRTMVGKLGQVRTSRFIAIDTEKYNINICGGEQFGLYSL